MCETTLSAVAQLNFELEIAHKPGPKLILADALSRSHVSLAAKQKASKLCSELSLKETGIVFSLDILDFTL